MLGFQIWSSCLEGFFSPFDSMQAASPLLSCPLPLLFFSLSCFFPLFPFLFFFFLPHWLNYKCTGVVSRTTRKSWCHCPGCFPHTGWSNCAGPGAYNRSLHGDFVFTVVLMPPPGSQMGEIFSLASSSRHKGLWIFHVTGFKGWGFLSLPNKAGTAAPSGICAVFNRHELLSGTDSKHWAALQHLERLIRRVLSPSELCFDTATALLAREQVWLNSQSSFAFTAV